MERTKGQKDERTKDDDQRRAAVWRALESVTDPEIPVLSVTDMGIIADVQLDEESVTVDMTPTFVGCPAVDVMRRDIHRAISELGETKVTVNVVFDPPWTSDRMSERGRQKLEAFGLAPPARKTASPTRRTAETGSADSARRDYVPLTVEEFEGIACPFCGSANTRMESMFGPTLCRSIHYCNACLQSFEHFKTV